MAGQLSTGYQSIEKQFRSYLKGETSAYGLTALVEAKADRVRRAVTETLLLERQKVQFPSTYHRDLANRFGIVSGDKRTALSRAAERLSQLVGRRLPVDSASEAGAVFAWWYVGHLGDQVRQHLKGISTPRRVSDIIGASRSKIVHWAEMSCSNEAEKVLVRSIEHSVQAAGRALSRGSHEIGDEHDCPTNVVANLEAAAEVCFEREASAALATDFLLNTSVNDVPKGAEADLLEAWILVKLIPYVAQRRWGWRIISSIWRPDFGGKTPLYAGSDQLEPGPLGKQFGQISVLENHLMGGAAIAAGAPLFTQQATERTNSHHLLEEKPAQALAVPIPFDNGMGQLNCSVFNKAPTPEAPGDGLTSVENPAVKAIFLCLADHIGDVLGRRVRDGRWAISLKGVREFEDLRKDIATHLKHDMGGRPAADERDVFYVIAAVPTPQCPPDARTAIQNLARSRALVKASGTKVYGLSRPGQFVFSRYFMSEMEWRALRDQPPGESAPIEVYQAFGKGPRELAGVIAEYKLTWKIVDLVKAKEKWKVKRLTKSITDSAERAALYVKDLNELRESNINGDFRTSLAVASYLYSRIGVLCNSVMNDLSRMCLHCGYLQAAQEFARERIEYAEWESTPHANLLLALLADGDLNAVGKLLEDTPLLTDHAQQALKRIGPDPNAVLTATLAIYHMARRGRSSEAEDWARVFANAVDSVAVGSESDRTGPGSDIVEVLTSPGPFVANRHKRLNRDLQMLDEIRSPQAWRERNMLRRLTLAARGAYLSARSPKEPAQFYYSHGYVTRRP